MYVYGTGKKGGEKKTPAPSGQYLVFPGGKKVPMPQGFQPSGGAYDLPGFPGYGIGEGAGIMPDIEGEGGGGGGATVKKLPYKKGRRRYPNMPSKSRWGRGLVNYDEPIIQTFAAFGVRPEWDKNGQMKFKRIGGGGHNWQQYGVDTGNPMLNHILGLNPTVPGGNTKTPGPPIPPGYNRPAPPATPKVPTPPGVPGGPLKPPSGPGGPTPMPPIIGKMLSDPRILQALRQKGII